MFITSDPKNVKSYYHDTGMSPGKQKVCSNLCIGVLYKKRGSGIRVLRVDVFF